jgi:TonB family protein
MRWILTALLTFLLPSCLVAQRTEADLRARLINKPLYLRGEWSRDKLAFDDAGHPEKLVAPVTFTLAGVDIQSVKLSAKELVLEGRRMGLEFEKDVPKRVGLMERVGLGSASPEMMTIRIKMPADGDFTTALDAIFVDGLADLVPQLPAFWQTFARRHFLPSETARDPAPAAGRQPAETAKLPRIGGGVSAPRLVTKVDPEYSETARGMKYCGIVLVNMIVDANGIPSHLQILRPAGLGLDEQALKSVSRYTFQPAKQNGSPVAVELNVEVNFQTF